MTYSCSAVIARFRRATQYSPLLQLIHHRVGPAKIIYLHLPGLLGAPHARGMTLENVFEQT